MTRLLVSVRSIDEALCAMDAGAQLIDVKEPRNGSLGRADSRVIESIAMRLSGQVPLSVALGELSPNNTAGSVKYAAGYDFAKIGLSQCRNRHGWLRSWKRAINSLPSGVAPVAVVYADWRTAGAPPPAVMLEAAGQIGCKGVLFDTFHKHQGDLLHHLSNERLRFQLRLIRSRGLFSAVAGSLSEDTIPQVTRLGPDIIAVRGAVCRGNRVASIHGDSVRDLLRLIQDAPDKNWR